ncbi:MAG: SagB/ThcOx family dehydrogenase [Candidatus Omnitrophica bacterium]|nr:SagB/ThcOx family dehydrogenase [Candidatus Omnitrophota bacterium]
MEKEIKLPQAQLKGKVPLEQAIQQRRSVRRYSSQELTLEQTSQLLWSAQGITQKDKGFRAVPSAGALYPSELYVLNKEGLFHYLPDGHSLRQVSQRDIRADLAQACRGQVFVEQAPLSIVIAMVYERVTSRYGSRGRLYADIEVGHIAQNVHLQAVALGLASVPVGAFDDEKVKNLLDLSKEQQPLYIIPIGYAE